MDDLGPGLLCRIPSSPLSPCLPRSHSFTCARSLAPLSPLHFYISRDLCLSFLSLPSLPLVVNQFDVTLCGSLSRGLEILHSLSLSLPASLPTNHPSLPALELEQVRAKIQFFFFNLDCVSLVQARICLRAVVFSKYVCMHLSLVLLLLL